MVTKIARFNGNKTKIDLSEPLYIFKKKNAMKDEETHNDFVFVPYLSWGFTFYLLKINNFFFKLHVVKRYLRWLSKLAKKLSKVGRFF